MQVSASQPGQPLLNSLLLSLLFLKYNQYSSYLSESKKTILLSLAKMCKVPVCLFESLVKGVKIKKSLDEVVHKGNT